LDTIYVPGGSIEAEVSGSGEPVLLIHGSIVADAFSPLLHEPALKRRYRLISYHRRGFRGSTLSSSLSISDQAADAAAVLKHYGVTRAHIVGHSYGGAIALQLALDAAETVGSLALLEPALMMVPSASQFMESMGPVVKAHSSGDKATAIDGILQGLGGPEYRSAADKTLPTDWFQRAVDDADTFFQVELPALQEWEFTADLAKKVRAPVLAVIGGESAPLFREGHELLKLRMPQSEPLTIPATAHLLQVENPGAIAEALSRFFAKHPLSELSSTEQVANAATHS
jgi:pimeloyl-ACP methyl ester carboxylesterase